MGKLELTDMIIICQHFSHLFLLLFVLFLLMDIYLFIRLDIPKVADYLTGFMSRTRVSQLPKHAHKVEGRKI